MTKLLKKKKKKGEPSNLKFLTKAALSRKNFLHAVFFTERHPSDDWLKTGFVQVMENIAQQKN